MLLLRLTISLIPLHTFALRISGHSKSLRSRILLPILVTTSRCQSNLSTASATSRRKSIISAMSTIDDSTTNTFKRVKLDDDKVPTSNKVIGTHSGTFQADEALGVWMLRQLSEYRNARVIRTRDTTQLQPLDLVLDVGGIYDHSSKRYDHHQRDYHETFDNEPNRCTKLSASGLIYRHYGRELITTYYPSLTTDQVEWTYRKLYDTLLEALDAVDTGVEACPPETKLLYKDVTGLSSRVSRLNPRWNEVVDETTGQKPSEDDRFEQAVTLCGNDLLSVLTGIVESDLPAQAFVADAVRKRHEIDPSGQIVVFESGGMPWRSHLYEMERKLNVDPLVKFVLYTDTSGMWRVQAVTVEGKSFENRLSLPESWRGLRDDALLQITNIPGCRFVHASGFIGGNDSYEGALSMARAALSLEQDVVKP